MPGNIKASNLRVLSGSHLLFPLHSLDEPPLHIGLAGTDPHLSDQDVIKCNPVVSLHDHAGRLDTGLEGINLVAGPAGVLGFGMGTQADAGTHRVATFTVVNKDLTGICVSAVSLNTPFTNEAGQRIAKGITLDDTCISL